MSKYHEHQSQVIGRSQLTETYIKDGAFLVFLCVACACFCSLFGVESVFSLAALELKLVAYIQDLDVSDVPFDASSIPKISKEQVRQESTCMSDLSPF